LVSTLLASVAYTLASGAEPQKVPLPSISTEFAGTQEPNTKLLNSRDKWEPLPRPAGKPMIVNIWATWCGGCVKEMPTLAALEKNYKGRITLAAVSIDEMSDRGQARTFLSKFPNLVFYQDPKGQLSRDITPAVKAYPTTVIYDKNGHEVARLLGGTTDWNSLTVHAIIDKLLAKT
jgi:thiol-disulfide isomerase/thioredoxin